LLLLAKDGKNVLFRLDFLNGLRQVSSFLLNVYLTAICFKQELKELIDIQLFLTRETFNSHESESIKYSSGRPDWTTVFSSLKDSEHVKRKEKPSKIGVFCCGPLCLKKDIKTQTRRFNKNGARFVFKPEDFD